MLNTSPVPTLKIALIRGEVEPASRRLPVAGINPALPLKVALIFASVIASSPPARAGGGPQNVLVVINNQSIESQEIGLSYRQARGIPARNICRVSVDPYLPNAAPTLFQTAIVDRIRGHIATHRLSNQIDYVVLCKELPSRVSGNEGATAVLFYGFKNAPACPPCSLPANTRSAYYQAERAFCHRGPFSETPGFLAMMLTAKTLFQAISNIGHSVRADGTAPNGVFYVVAPPGDAARNIRYKLFNSYDFDAHCWTGQPKRELVYADSLPGKTNVLGYFTGRPDVPNAFLTNTVFLPGALADHLTSVGGYLPVPPQGQSSILEWIRGGVSASYGTVAEPCAYLEKFPDPMAFFWYARGFNLAESYWMSVANPYQGLFVGEPLAAPYAKPPAVTFLNVSSNQIVSGLVDLQVEAGTNAAGIPSQALDLYVDDLWVGTLTNVGPTAGNILEAVVGGITCSYTVAEGDTLYSAVTGLAQAINATGTSVRAHARGDRILLVYTNYGQPGAHVTCQAQTRIGEGAELTVWGQALSSNLLESLYPAREYVSLRGTANTGDTVTCLITLTNGLVVTNLLVAQQGQTSTALMGLLKGMINSNADLQATNGVRAVTFTYYPTSEMALEARRPGPEGYNLFVNYRVTQAIPASGLDTNVSFSDYFNDAEDYVFADPQLRYHVLTARGHLRFWCGRQPLMASYEWDTSGLPNGRYTLRVVAREGAATETQGHALLPVVVSNSPLACRLVAPTNEAFFVLGSNVLVQAAVTNESTAITQVVFYVEDKAHTVLTNAPWVMAFQTLDYGVGRVPVRALAWENAGACAVSDIAWVNIQRSPTLDTDGDGIPDSWEQHYFGGLYGYDATSDPDGDGVSNYKEFISLTDPNDSNSYFRIGIETDTNRLAVISFFAATGRVYEVHYTPEASTNFDNWRVASPSPLPGLGGVTNWVDDGLETEPPPALTTQRLYRVRVALPD